MIVEERMRTFINSLEPGEPAWLDEIRSSALQDNVPIIRMEMGSLLRFLLTLRRPSSILEVGTAVGYSALFMSEYMPENCHITTIEKYEKRIPIAKQNFKTAGREDKITLLEGDAAEILAELSQPFDFIFMDAAKGQYIHFLPDVLRLLAPEAVCWCRTMCCRTEISSSPAMRWQTAKSDDSYADAGIFIHPDPP